VPVFDVGFEAGHVYIVMELIRGATLRAWVEGRSVAEILDAYRQAGLALAAAHDAGLVHRDFKPDNAIVGTDRRVRVVDFGLACETRAATRAPVGGTPAYMAPEQADGAATPAADQYSFGIALREAIASPRPRWIEDVIERATAASPEARFGSMHELLRALARDPARLHRRRIALASAGVAVAAVAAVAFFVGRRASVFAVSEEPCAGSERELDTSWEANQVARIATLSAYGKTIAPQLGDRLERHRTRWIANHHGACIAHRIGVESDALLDRRMACLDRNRAALAELAETLRDADAAALPNVVRAATELPDPDRCGDVTALLSEVAPPAPAQAERVGAVRRDLERARVLIAGGWPEKARDLAARAVAEARATTYTPALAEALLVEGHARMSDRAPTEALQRLAESSRLAFESGMLSIGIEAWARRAWLAGMHAPADPAVGAADTIEALATRATPFARALLHNNLGSVELARGDRVAARAELARSVEAAREVRGPGALELTAIRFTLAAATEDLAEKERVLREAATEAAQLEGPDHPDALRAIWIRLTTIPQDLTTLAPQLAALCERDELHVGFATRTTECWVELAAIYDALGDVDRALAAADRAVALGAEHSDD
ncbi:MAG TPA: serine/threonine-protein kinase, partial [Kofleriaceae bacterium]